VGLVESEEDFGTQGEPPSHPELLDLLAISYADSGWDTKKLLRLIVTSATYRQSSKATAQLLDRDRGTALLGRAPRMRLEAEMVRDQAMALSGLLSRKLGGPSVFLPSRMGCGRRRSTASAPGRPVRGQIAIGAGSTHFGGELFPILRWPPSTRRAAKICAIKRMRTIPLSSRSSP